MKGAVRVVACAVLAGAAALAHAGGPLGSCYGSPVKYAGAGNVALRFDLGTLGSRSKAQADALVTNAIALWTNVGTSTVSLTRSTDLPVDVTAANFSTYYNQFSDGINPVIYDTDGSITDAIIGAGAHTQILGFAGSAWSDNGAACQYVEGQAIINGAIAVSDTVLTNVLAHEVGHLIGLDHTQLDNAQGLATSNYPLMYPIAYRSVASLHEDDAAAITALYPDTTKTTAYGDLTGTFATASGTPILGANIFAQGTGGVFSVVSDYLEQTNGAFRLLLPPGTYTLRAEAIDPSFTGGSSVGPYSETATSPSFQAPLYSGSTPMPTVTLGGSSATQITITAGCTATSTFRIDGTGSIGGNCGPTAPPKPNTPTLVSPTGTIAAVTPTYTWNASANTATYELTVQSAAGTLAALSYSAAAAGCVAGTGQCSVTPSMTLVPGTPYSWTVRASNASGASAWSSLASFQIGTPPQPPVTLAPNATTAAVTPAYTWFADLNSTSYEILVTSASGVVVDQLYSAAAAGCGAGTGICSVTPSTALTVGTLYTWSVSGRNAFGTSAWSPGRAFSEVGPPGGINVALAANGGVASASSVGGSGFPAASLNNGDRAGLNWGAGGGWRDNTANAYPDWVQLDFNGAKTIDRVVVYSLQDTPSAPIEPTDSSTFAMNGATAFTVEYWNGSAWAQVASVTGNNLVKRTVTFAPVTTTKVRVNIIGTPSNYSRLTEIEVFGAAARTNVALAANGATITASSSGGTGFPVDSLINGDRAGLNWGAGGGWRDNTANAYPDWVEIDFAGTQTIDTVNVYSLQDTPTAPVEPLPAMTFANYGATAFTVQYWNGSGWVQAASVSGNNLVKRTVTFTPVTTTKVRVNITATPSNYSRLTEIEVFGSAARTNVALATNGGTVTASSSGGTSFPAQSLIDGDRAGFNWGAGGGWRDNTANAYPDWVEIAFAGTPTIDTVNVYSLQDTQAAPVEPTDAMTFANYGATAFTVEYWNGSGWVQAASVSGNNLVKRTVAFTPVATSKVRVNILATPSNYSRLTEIEVLGQ